MMQVKPEKRGFNYVLLGLLVLVIIVWVVLRFI